jgi:thiamine-phosphate pyrophosphorylase
VAPLDVARAFLDGGARFLQLRAKSLSSAAFLQFIDEVVADVRRRGALVIANDRVDLGKLGGADGVHIGQEDLSPLEVRAQLGPRALVGLSTHTEAQLAAAAREPVDYVAIGPVFVTATKETGHAALGLEGVRLARRLTPAHVPVVAIGGITIDIARSVIDAGAASVAVIGDLLAGPPAERVREFLRRCGSP